jgi:hypothetical protein
VNFPLISNELMDAIEVRFDQAPIKKLSNKDLRWLAAQQSMVRELKAINREQRIGTKGDTLGFNVAHKD